MILPSNKITISNKLVNGKYSLSKTESLLVAKIISLIRMEDEDFKTYIIPISELLPDGSKNHRQIKDACTSLVKSVITIQEENGRIETNISWFSCLKYNGVKGYVEARFDREMKPYLLDLKGNYTEYYLINILQLKGRHQKRIYELLKAFENLKKRHIKFSELIEILELPKSMQSFGQFKNQILLKSQISLEEKTDIYFDFEVEKKGHAVDKIKFKIYTNEKNVYSSKERKIMEFINKVKKEYAGCDLPVVQGNLSFHLSNDGLLYKLDGDDEFVALDSHEAYEEWKDIYNGAVAGNLPILKEKVYTD